MYKKHFISHSSFNKNRLIKQNMRQCFSMYHLSSHTFNYTSLIKNKFLKKNVKRVIVTSHEERKMRSITDMLHKIINTSCP